MGYRLQVPGVIGGKDRHYCCCVPPQSLKGDVSVVETAFVVWQLATALGTEGVAPNSSASKLAEAKVPAELAYWRLDICEAAGSRFFLSEPHWGGGP